MLVREETAANEVTVLLLLCIVVFYREYERFCYCCSRWNVMMDMVDDRLGESCSDAL